MARSKPGQIRGKDIKSLTQQVDDYAERLQTRTAKFKPLFRDWVLEELDEIHARIKSKDYAFAVQATIQHLEMRVKQIEQGDLLYAIRRPDGTATFGIPVGDDPPVGTLLEYHQGPLGPTGCYALFPPNPARDYVHGLLGFQSSKPDPHVPALICESLEKALGPFFPGLTIRPKRNYPLQVDLRASALPRLKKHLHAFNWDEAAWNTTHSPTQPRGTR